MENELRLVFESTEVEIVTINNKPMFEIYSTGMALGQVKKNSKGVAYPRKERIDENLKNAEIEPCVHNGHLFINESQLYDLMFEMKTDKVKPFRKWVTGIVLPQIRLTGGYIPIEETDSDDMVMAKALKIADKTIQEKDTLIQLLKPQAEAYQDLMQAEGYLQFLDVSAMVEIGRTTLFQFLRSKKVLTKQSTFNIPYGKFANNGMFKVLTAVSEKGYISSVTMVSPKGLNYIYKLIKKNELLNNFDTTSLLSKVKVA